MNHRGYTEFSPGLRVFTLYYGVCCVLKMYKSLVLCGNSTNAFISLGALQYLYEHGVLKSIKKYYATSSGTIISLLLIIGYSPLEIICVLCYKKVFSTIGVLNLANIFVGKTLSSFKPIHDFLDFLIIEKIGYIPTMVQLCDCFDVEFTLTTYNITDAKREYITSKTHPDILITCAIEMSCSFPLIFEPCSCNEKLYVDGGFVDNFPLSCTDSRDICLGVYTLNPVSKHDGKEVIVDFILRMFLVLVQTVSVDKIERAQNCDFITLRTKMNFFNFSSTNKELLHLFDTGYALCKDEVKNGVLKHV